MKKILSVFLVLILAFSLASCDSRRQASSEPEAPSSSEPAAPESSNAVSASSAATKSYSIEEAVAINSKLNDADIHLLQSEAPKAGQPIVSVTTSAGDITIALFPDEAPKAVENFIAHIKKGYYNGQSFYKALDGFLLQTGKPEGAEPKSASGEPFESEYSLDLWSFRGALIMVNDGAANPNSNKSEFMIVQADFVSDDIVTAMEAAVYPEKVINHYKQVGGLPGFDWHNTVFGMVTEGMDIIDKIASGESDENGSPVKPAIIYSVSIKE